MYNLKLNFLFIVLLFLSCSNGGPLTPLESFNSIKHAVEKNDSDAILSYLTESSLTKINEFNIIIKEINSDQLSILSSKYGIAPDRLKTLKTSDSVSLYFFSDNVKIKLGKYFKENIVSVDIHGSSATVKTESGIELDFKREGPYWKFDLSDL